MVSSSNHYRSGSRVARASNPVVDTMTIPIKNQVDLVSIARRTLGRPEHDKRPIPPQYTEALRRYVAKHPNHTNFLIDLEDHGGMVTCMVCLRDVPVGNWISQGVYEFKDLKLFEDHILSVAHKQKVAASVKTRVIPGFSSRQGAATGTHKATAGGSSSGLTSRLSRTSSNARAPSLAGIQPPSSSDVEPNSSEPPSPVPSVIELTSSDEAPSPIKGKGKNSTQARSWTFPDGEVITIDSSSDDENAAGDATFSQDTVMATPQASTSRGAPVFSQSFSAFGGPRTASLKRSTSDAPWDYRSASRASSSRSPSASETSHSHLKRPYQYPDGEVVYATEEETDGGSSSKKMRYDTESEGAMETDADVMDDEDSDEDMVYGYQGAGPLGPFGRARAETLMPPHLQPDAIAQATAEMDRQMRETFARMDAQFPDFGYHAPPAPGGLAARLASRSQRSGGDFNLNYDNESPRTWQDIGGPDHAEQLKRFFDDTMDDHEGSIPVKDAAKALGLKGTTDRLPGMEVPLMPHQLIGVSWMINQELGKVQGGVLADDMGLGKTMQTIALIVKNQPEKKNPRKSTLIVAPAALLDQWRQEIVDRTEDGMFRIRIHHGKEKLKTAAEVKKYDIIITTYQTLTNEFPVDDEELKKKKQKKKRAKKDEDGFIISDSEDNKKRSKKAGGLGPLAATQWYRVVLDEAQNIRNRSTRSSRMMARLDAEYRWALTGTPVTNSLADLYGLIRFLHFAPWNDWADFNERIAKLQKSNAKLAGQRAQALLKKCLLRRTKESKLEGKPLITLQPKTIEIEQLEFSPDERQIYAAVEARQQLKLNRFLKAGTVMKNYTAILVMILRLRQACNHPQLIAYTRGDMHTEGAYVVGEDDGEDGSQPTGTNNKSLARAHMGEEKFELAMRQFRDIAKEMYVAELTGGDIPDNQATECGICLEPYTDDCCVTSCGHIFCKECLNELFDAPLQGDAAADDQFVPNARPCPNCRSQIAKNRIFAGSIFALSETEKDEIKRQVDKEHGAQYKTMHTEDDDDDFVPIRKGKGKARARIEDHEDDEAREEQMESELKKLGDDAVVPGAKMVRVAKLLEQWHREAPEDKIIAYSQWTSMIDLMQILLKRDGIESLRFDGKMSRIERDETLTKFKKQGGPKILLISLKCGGFGLNLTEANRVICMDLAWNAATENQAIDRVHRMGQVKSVVVKRLIIKDTIEDRILKLQAQKQGLSDAALGEGTGAKMPRMNVAQLKTLFGM